MKVDLNKIEFNMNEFGILLLQDKKEEGLVDSDLYKFQPKKSVK